LPQSVFSSVSEGTIVKRQKNPFLSEVDSLTPSFNIKNYSRSFEISAITIDNSPLSTIDDSSSTATNSSSPSAVDSSSLKFWVGFKSRGIGRVNPEGKLKFYTYDSGCRFVSVKKIISTSAATAVLGDNGNLQFFSGNLFLPSIKGVSDFIINKSNCFFLVKNRLFHSTITTTGNLSKPSLIGKTTVKAVLMGGTVGKVYVKGTHKVWEITKPDINKSTFSIVKNSFLSRSQILKFKYNGETGLIEHGFGLFSYFKNKKWSSIKNSTFMSTSDNIFISSKTPWIYEGSTLSRFDSGKTSLNISIPSKEKITSIESNNKFIWLGTKNGNVYQYNRNSNYLTALQPADSDRLTAIKTLSFNGRYLLTGTTNFIYRLSVKKQCFNKIGGTNSSGTPITGLAVVSPFLFYAADRKAIHRYVLPAQKWLNKIVAEPANFISVTGGDELIAISNNRLTTWDLTTLKLTGRTKFNHSPIIVCNFFKGLVYYATRSSVYRLNTKSPAVPSDLWNVCPPFRLGRRGWQQEKITGMTTDSLGVIVSNNIGEVKRIACFINNAGKITFVKNPDKKRTVTGLVARGTKLYGAFAGKKQGIYVTDVNNVKSNWNLIASSESKVKKTVLSGSWLIGSTNNSVILVNLANSSTLTLDGTYGTFAGSVNTISVYGNTLYIGGKGVSTIRLPAKP